VIGGSTIIYYKEMSVVDLLDALISEVTIRAK